MVFPSFRECLTRLNDLFKNPNADDLVGLDIGVERLKLIQINKDTPNTIEHLAFSELVSQDGAKSETKNHALLGSTLKKIFQEQSIKAKNIAFAIPHMNTIIKNFTVDRRLSDDEIESRTWLEANSLFPDLIDNIFLDYVATEPLEANSTKQDVMIIACRKDQITPYIDALKQEGLNSAVVDIDCYVLQRALSAIASDCPVDEKIALLNLDFHLMTLIATQNNTLTYVHEQNYKGRNVYTQISKYLFDKGLTETESTGSLLQDAEYAEILKQNLGAYLRHTMQFFYSKDQSRGVNKLFLSGDLATIPEINVFIEEATNIPTVISNPFKNMKLPSHVNEGQVRKNAPAFMLSYGLALSKVNAL